VVYPEVDDDPALRRGFDRLRTHGFSIQEVAALRSYFNAQVLAYAARQAPREGEAVEERRNRMDEEWMGRQGEGSEFALNTNRVVATRAVFAAARRGGGEGGGGELGGGTARGVVGGGGGRWGGGGCFSYSPLLTTPFSPPSLPPSLRASRWVSSPSFGCGTSLRHTPKRWALS